MFQSLQIAIFTLYDYLTQVKTTFKNVLKLKSTNETD